MDRKRGRIEIIRDMLEAVNRKGGVIKPTHLMYKANLSHNQMKSYLEELIGKGLMEKQKQKRSEKITLTKSGYIFLRKLNEIESFERALGF